MDISFSYLVLLFILGFLFPINGILAGKQIKQRIEEDPEGKLAFYKQTLILQFILAFLVFAAMYYNGDSLKNIGLGLFGQPIWILGLIIIALLGCWVINKIKMDPSKAKRKRKENQEILFLLPATMKEYRWAMSVSFAAGISEEIVFRGFLFWQLSQFLPLIPAILLCNIIFGLCHYGTGIKNALQAFGLGVLLSISYTLTGSLFLAMLIHILGDVYAVTMAKKYLLEAEI